MRNPAWPSLSFALDRYYRHGEGDWTVLCLEARDLIDAYVAATGGLPLKLVAKALRYACAPTSGTLTAAELTALRAATFEVTE